MLLNDRKEETQGRGRLGTSATVECTRGYTGKCAVEWSESQMKVVGMEHPASSGSHAV